MNEFQNEIKREIKQSLKEIYIFKNNAETKLDQLTLKMQDRRKWQQGFN